MPHPSTRHFGISVRFPPNQVEVSCDFLTAPKSPSSPPPPLHLHLNLPFLYSLSPFQISQLREILQRNPLRQLNNTYNSLWQEYNKKRISQNGEQERDVARVRGNC